MPPNDTNPLSFDAVIAGLHLPDEVTPLWAAGWCKSQACYPEAGPGFLAPGFVGAGCRRIEFPDAITAAVLAAADAVRGNPLLARLAWHCHRLMFVAPGLLKVNMPAWPMLPDRFGQAADLFYALLFLSGLPQVEREHARRGIPWQTTLDTLRDLELWIHEYRRRHGVWGMSEQRWLQHHFAGNLFALGRLQFQFSALVSRLHAIRHRRTGQVVVLLGDGMTVDAHGQPALAAPGQPTAFSRDVRHIRGIVVSPQGRILAGERTLPAAEWVEIAAPGCPALAVHIPAGGRLTPAACADSFAQAREFFGRHYPERPFRVFTCTSWFLDPQLVDWLPPESSIVRFQREVYLVPVPGANDTQTFQRVFGGPVADPATAPRDTALRRAILDHVRQGGCWRQGGCMLFPEDLPWDRQPYLTLWPGVLSLDAP